MSSSYLFIINKGMKLKLQRYSLKWLITWDIVYGAEAATVFSVLHDNLDSVVTDVTNLCANDKDMFKGFLSFHVWVVNFFVSSQC